ncbi:MAG: EamA family transporter [Nitrospinae bacterium]|nr:EamA family transporter [Nitrospinota bacterium]
MVQMIVATLLFGLGPVLIRMGLNEGISPEHILVLRMMVALPLFAVTALFFRQLKSSALSMRDFAFVSVVSVAGMGGAMYCFIHSIELLGASVSTLLGAVSPAITVLMAWRLGRSPITPLKVVSLAVSFAGVALLLLPVIGIGNLGAVVAGSMAGVGYSMLANLCSSAAMLAFEKYMERKSPLVAAFHITAFMFIYAEALYGMPPLALGLKTWVIVLLLGSVAWFVPFMLFFYGIRALGASKAALVQNSGPAVTVLAAGFLLNERLVLAQLAGMALVLSSVYLLKKDTTPAPPPGGDTVVFPPGGAFQDSRSP